MQWEGRSEGRMTPTLAIGQIWKQERYVARIVSLDERGWPWVRHVNAKQGGMLVRPEWFTTKPEDGGWEFVR